MMSTISSLRKATIPYSVIHDDAKKAGRPDSIDLSMAYSMRAITKILFNIMLELRIANEKGK